MTFTKTILAGTMACILASGAAFAQTAAPATPPASPTMAAPSASSAMPAGGMDKKAISKACSDEATQQNLHGKARKTFRSKCKMQKMKGM